MSRLPELERSLIDAAERLDDAATHTAVAPPTLRSRWRRLSRRGHVAGVLAGSLVLGAVATGSAQVAGLGPFAFLDRSQRVDTGLLPRGGPDSVVEIRSPHGTDPAWLAKVFVSRRGELCMTAGRATTERNPAGGVSCSDRDDVGEAIAAPGNTARSITTYALIRGTQRHPERAVVYGVVGDGSPGFGVTTSVATGAALTPAHPASGRLRYPLDKRRQGLSSKEAAIVARFPEELWLRPFAVEVDLPMNVRRSGDLIVEEAPNQSAGEPPRVVAVDFDDWQRAYGSRGPAPLLERKPEPVRSATALGRRLVPALRRAHRAADAVPSRLLTRDTARWRAQPDAGRRLRATDDQGLGPTWVLPGAMMEHSNAMANGRYDSAMCLVGTRALTRCFPIDGRRPALPRLEAVVCAPGLSHDDFLVWALVPRGAKRAQIRFADGTSRDQSVRDLLLVRRPKTASRVTSVTWIGPKLRRRERAKFPANAATARCAGPKGPTKAFTDLRESATSSGLSMWTAN